ncbi:hypothetical protein BT96DRAFT_1006711 [Gymnopus androsaceus JB14]|uniref:Uncharacterized protein n=1 Tax=Gymnopus androsaceus JB14 TaxID=1447944 RepID=A0A6A4GJE8_9AGAR|nr:hypothetical protein BT96DRAFT_1006711 [Gymnopus androsaceus JB14]
MANVTIDDSDPSIIYLPAWNTRNASVPCPTCTANPQADLMFNETWHDNTFYPAPGSSDFANIPIMASMLFNGTALYVFCAIAESSTSPDGDSDMSFYIDGELKGTFVEIAPGNAGHNFTLQGGHVNGFKSLVLLDKMVYTCATTVWPFEDLLLKISTELLIRPLGSSNTSSASSSPVATQPETVAVSVAFFLLAAAMLWFFLQRRKRKRWYNLKRRRITIDPISPTTSAWTSDLRPSPYSHSLHNGLNYPAPILQPQNPGPSAGPGTSAMQHNTASRAILPYPVVGPVNLEDDEARDEAPPAYDESRMERGVSFHIGDRKTQAP